MSLAFDIRTVLVEAKDSLRLGMATKRGQDFFQSLVQAINQLVSDTGYGTAIPSSGVSNSPGSPGTSSSISRSDHQHRTPGGIAALLTVLPAISTVETQVLGASIPGGLLASGTVLQVKAFASVTATTNDDITFNLRVGPTTLTGNIPASLTCKPGNSGTVTLAQVVIDLTLMIQTDGATGTCAAFGTVISLSSGAAITQALELANELFVPGIAAVDTTIANVVELTCATAAATVAVTFEGAVISVVKL